MKRFTLVLLLPCFGLLACSDDGDGLGDGNGSGPGGMGPGADVGGPMMEDMGPPMPPVGVCPDSAALARAEQDFDIERPCGEVSECFFGNDDFSIERDCEFCEPYAPRTHCTYYQCENTENNPEDLVAAANVRVTTAQVPDVRFLVVFAIQQETSGGARLSCEADIAPAPGSFDLDNPCYNILLVNKVDVSSDGGDTFLVPATRFSNDRDVMFLVYGFENVNATGDPVGVYCTEASFGRETQEMMTIGNSAPSFDTMVPLP